MSAGRIVGELTCPPTPPWGLDEATPRLATASLEPGDSLLLYTDGVIEARTPSGESFGLEGLVDVAQSNGSDLIEPQEVVRLIMRSVLDHQQADLVDDATVLLIRWDGPPS